MFKVAAGSVEEYFRFDPAREDALRELDAVIRAATLTAMVILLPARMLANLAGHESAPKAL
jgi:hypothetical protein